MFLKREEHSVFFEKSLLFPNTVDGHVQHIPSASAAYNVTEIYDFLILILTCFSLFSRLF